MATFTKQNTDEVPEGSNLKIPHLLEVKRDGGELTEDQMKVLVNSISAGTMEDVQLGAFLMSVYIQGLSKKEIAALTLAMRDSGTCFKWPDSWTVVDKHSTGGVGDKISLVLAPVLASKGLKVPMISGRGLAHTGGTLDKLESIPGFRVSLTEEEMKKTLTDVGCCIVGQTASLVPADKRMYSSRDVTGTVPSLPLTVSSIISKKSCESLDSLVLDVKYGCGAFMKTQSEAEELAEALVDASERLGIKTTALVTCMDYPLGKKIGNTLEVEEAIECLRGDGPKQIVELVLSLGAELLVSTGMASTIEEGKSTLEETLRDGSALRTFSKMMIAQGVDVETAEKLCGENYKDCLPKSIFSTKLLSPAAGIINDINAMTVAEVCLSLGAGRIKTSDRIRHSVGMVLIKTLGDEISEGEPWAEIKHDFLLDTKIKEKAESALFVSKVKQQRQALIVKRIVRSN